MYIRMVGRERDREVCILGWWGERDRGVYIRMVGERDREVCILGWWGERDREVCVY